MVRTLQQHGDVRETERMEVFEGQEKSRNWKILESWERKNSQGIGKGRMYGNSAYQLITNCSRIIWFSMEGPFD